MERPALPAATPSLLHQAWHSGPVVISLAAFLFSISTAAVKLMGTRVPTFEVVFFPGLVCFALTSIIQSFFFCKPPVKAKAEVNHESSSEEESRSTASPLATGLSRRPSSTKQSLLQQADYELKAAAAAVGRVRMFPAGDEESQAEADLSPPSKLNLQHSIRSSHSKSRSETVRNAWILPTWLWQSSAVRPGSGNAKPGSACPELEPLLLHSPGNKSPSAAETSPISAVARERGLSVTPVKRLAQLNSHSLHGLLGVGSSTGSGWTPAGFDSGDGDGCSSADDGDVLGGSDGAGVLGGGGSVGGGVDSGAGGAGGGELTSAAAAAVVHAAWLSRQSPWLSALLCVLRGVLGAASITMLFTSVTELRIKDAVTIFFCSPAIAALLEWLLIGSITASTLIGCALTITGVALVSQPAFIFDRPGTNGLLLPPLHGVDLDLMDFDLSSSDQSLNPISQILNLITSGMGSDQMATVDPTAMTLGETKMMGMALAAAAALCNAAAFVVARRTNASALTLTWFYHGIVVATTAVPLLLLKFPSGPVFPGRDDCLLLGCVAVTQMAAQLLLNRGLQLVSATRGSAINVLQVMFSWGFDLLLNDGDQEDPVSSTSTMLSLLGSVCVVLGVLASGRVVEEKHKTAVGQVKKDDSRMGKPSQAGLLGMLRPAGSDKPPDGNLEDLGFDGTQQQRQLQAQQATGFAQQVWIYQSEPHGSSADIPVLEQATLLGVVDVGIQISASDPDRDMNLDQIQILDAGSFKRSTYLPTRQASKGGATRPPKHNNRRLSISASVPNFEKFAAAAALVPGISQPEAPTAVSRWRLGLGPGLATAPSPAAAALLPLAAVPPAAEAAVVVEVAGGRPYGRGGVMSSSVPTSIVPRGGMTSDSASSSGNSDDSSSEYSSSAGTPAAGSLAAEVAL